MSLPKRDKEKNLTQAQVLNALGGQDEKQQAEKLIKTSCLLELRQYVLQLHALIHKYEPQMRFFSDAELKNQVTTTSIMEISELPKMAQLFYAHYNSAVGLAKVKGKKDILTKPPLNKLKEMHAEFVTKLPMTDDDVMALAKKLHDAFANQQSKPKDPDEVAKEELIKLILSLNQLIQEKDPEKKYDLQLADKLQEMDLSALVIELRARWVNADSIIKYNNINYTFINAYCDAITKAIGTGPEAFSFKELTNEKIIELVTKIQTHLRYEMEMLSLLRIQASDEAKAVSFIANCLEPLLKNKKFFPDKENEESEEKKLADKIVGIAKTQYVQIDGKSYHKRLVEIHDLLTRFKQPGKLLTALKEGIEMKRDKKQGAEIVHVDEAIKAKMNAAIQEIEQAAALAAPKSSAAQAAHGKPPLAPTARQKGHR